MQLTKEQFKTIRKELQYTQKEFAEMLGLTIRMITYYESGQIPVNRTVSILVNRIYQDEKQEKAMKIGQRIKAKDQEIYGKIVWLYPNEVVIEDEDAETEDNQLCFKLSEVEQIKEKQERNMKRYFVEIKRDMKEKATTSFYIYSYSKKQIVDMLGNEYFIVCLDITE